MEDLTGALDTQPCMSQSAQISPEPEPDGADSVPMFLIPSTIHRVASTLLRFRT